MTTYRGFVSILGNFQFCRCGGFGVKGQNIFARIYNSGSIELEAEADIWPFGAFCTTGCAVYTTEMTEPGYRGKIELVPYTGGWEDYMLNPRGSLRSLLNASMYNNEIQWKTTAVK